MPWFNRSLVKVLPAEPRTLRKALKSLWSLSYKVGVLPDWCELIPKTAPSLIIHVLGTILSLFIVTLLTLYHWVQLIIQVQISSSIHSLVTNLVWCCVYTVTLFCQLYYVICRSHLATFLTELDLLEQQDIIRNYLLSKIISMPLLVIVLYFDGFDQCWNPCI